MGIWGIMLLSIVAGAQDYPDHYDSALILMKSDSLAAAGEARQALLGYQSILPIDPEYTRACFHAASMHTYLNETAEAIEFLRRINEIGGMKDNPDLLLLFSALLVMDSSYNEASGLLSQAMAITPDYPPIWYLTARISYAQKRITDAVSELQKAVTLHPDYLVAHAFLGRICLEEGYIVEGHLALIFAVALNPEAGESVQSLPWINVKLSQNYLNKSGRLPQIEGTDQFDEIETVLRNQLPLHPQYQLRCAIDDIHTRNIQALIDYAATHTSNRGFFETMYLPLLKEISVRGYTESFLYYLQQGFRDKLGNKLTSKDKLVKKFEADFVSKDMWSTVAKRTVERDGNLSDVIIFNEDSFPYLKGTVRDGQYEGHFLMTDKFGRKSADLFFKNDKLSGKQQYYFTDGTLKSMLTYVDGVLEGESAVWHPNGNIKERLIMSNGEQSGNSEHFYPLGGPVFGGNVKDKNNMDGPYVLYFPNGLIKEEGTRVADLWQGELRRYTKSGDLEELIQTKDGWFDGNYIMYYNGSTIRTVGQYKEGSHDGAWRSYSASGKVIAGSLFREGILRFDTLFTETGVVTTALAYDLKGELESIHYFDLYGKKIFEEEFSKSVLKRAVQYHANKPPSKFSIADGVLTIRDLDGNAVHSGMVKKGMRVGEWTTFYANGKIENVRNYQNGIIEGKVSEYSDNGLIRSEKFFSQGMRDGRGTYYQPQNKQVAIDYSIKDSGTGPYVTFHEDGSIKSETYLVDGLYQYPIKNYNKDGKLISIFDYTDDFLIRETRFSLSGDTIFQQDYTNLNGEIQGFSSSPDIIVKGNYKNGVLNGLRTLSLNGLTLDKSIFVNDVLHESRIGKYVNDQPRFRNEIYCGKPHGRQVYFHPDGKLNQEYSCAYGSSQGRSNYYYQNDALYRTGTFENGFLEGEVTYSDFHGSPVISLGFTQNMLVYYRPLDERGNLGDKIILDPRDSVRLHTVYPNKNPAFQATYVRSNIHGPLVIYSRDNQICLERNYWHGLIDGHHKEYFPSGKLYVDQTFAMGDQEGSTRYYNEQGQLMLKLEYVEDELHGSFELYSEDKLLETFHYDQGIPGAH